MSMREIMLFAVLTLGLVTISASPSLAACVQRDLAGTWDIYTTSNTNFFEDPTQFGCTLIIRPGGGLTPGTNCINDLGTNGTVIGGRLTVNAACVARGTYYVKDKVYGTVSPFTIRRATVDRSKTTATGVGTNPNTGGFFVNMIKK